MASDSRVSNPDHDRDEMKAEKGTGGQPEASRDPKPQNPDPAPKLKGNHVPDSAEGQLVHAGKPKGSSDGPDALDRKPESEDAAQSPVKETAGRFGWFSNARGRFLLFAAVPSWLISMILHAVFLMILALATLPEQVAVEQIVAFANPQSNVEEIEEYDEEEIDPVDVQAFMSEASIDLTDVEPTQDDMTMPEYEDIDAAPQHFELDEIADLKAPNHDMSTLVGAITGSALQGRGAEARRAAVKSGGGSKGSEASVASALSWIAEHQERDGGWSFNHQRGVCRGRCSHAGVIPSARNGATAIALLPFLGAGQTHKKGKYKESVERGLAFLIRQMKVRGGMGDLSDSGGNLYSHGLCTIALCEAYAMTNDRELMQPAQMALNYTIFAQDPLGGGWRYKPHQAGDTSALGWQLMACKSGHMAYLKVPNTTIQGASAFLDFVQVENGARYGYTVPSPSPSTTAVGLLCRMYIGWKKDHPALKAGVEYISKTGPSDSIYYDYYATQVMRHYGGELWEEWNRVMRDRLVNSQDKKGHAKGSWYFPKTPHGSSGGRLYCTAMATMILEVYYRYLPIYGKQAAEEEFPL